MPELMLKNTRAISEKTRKTSENFEMKMRSQGKLLKTTEVPPKKAACELNLQEIRKNLSDRLMNLIE